jgi:hypothetical protein
MKKFGFVLKIVTLSFSVVLIFMILVAIQVIYSASKPVQGNLGMALKIPPFLNAARAASAEEGDLKLLLEDAGIIAYVKLSKEIDLADFPASYFILPSKETEGYTGGTVIIPGSEAILIQDTTPEVHLVVHRTGWLVAYLSRFQPSAALFDWVTYDSDKKKLTSLERVLIQASQNAGETINLGSVAYYDLRNREATNILLAGDSVDVSQPQNTFNLLIPRKVTVYEFSISQAIVQRDVYELGAPSTCQLQGSEIISSNGIPNRGATSWRLASQTIEEQYFHTMVGKPLLFALYYNSGYQGQSYCGVAIIYRESIE